jgi:hypothetical protein
VKVCLSVCPVCLFPRAKLDLPGSAGESQVLSALRVASRSVGAYGRVSVTQTACNGSRALPDAFQRPRGVLAQASIQPSSRRRLSNGPRAGVYPTVLARGVVGARSEHTHRPSVYVCRRRTSCWRATAACCWRTLGSRQSWSRRSRRRMRRGRRPAARCKRHTSGAALLWARRCSWRPR